MARGTAARKPVSPSWLSTGTCQLFPRALAGGSGRGLGAVCDRWESGTPAWCSVSRLRLGYCFSARLLGQPASRGSGLGEICPVGTQRSRIAPPELQEGALSNPPSPCTPGCWLQGQGVPGRRNAEPGAGSCPRAECPLGVKAAPRETILLPFQAPEEAAAAF